MRGAVFLELGPREQWEGGGEAGGRRPGQGWRWRRPASWAPGRGVSPGHRAESRGVWARENRGWRWRGPGGGGGRGPSPPGWDGKGEGAQGGVSSSSPRRSPQPSSSAATQVGAGPRWEAGGGSPAPGGLAGLSPLLSSSPQGPARLLPTRGPGSGGAPPGCSFARPWLPRRPGSPPFPLGEPAGAGRRGETG